MSKGLFVKDNGAIQKIKKWYIDDLKIKRAYIKTNGENQLFFAPGSIWKKYDVIINSTPVYGYDVAPGSILKDWINPNEKYWSYSDYSFNSTTGELYGTGQSRYAEILDTYGNWYIEYSNDTLATAGQEPYLAYEEVQTDTQSHWVDSLSHDVSGWADQFYHSYTFDATTGKYYGVNPQYGTITAANCSGLYGISRYGSTTMAYFDGATLNDNGNGSAFVHVIYYGSQQQEWDSYRCYLQVYAQSYYVGEDYTYIPTGLPLDSIDYIPGQKPGPGTVLDGSESAGYYVLRENENIAYYYKLTS